MLYPEQFQQGNTDPEQSMLWSPQAVCALADTIIASGPQTAYNSS